MANKIDARIRHKHDTEENWLKATNFVPLLGEMIVYDPDASYSYARIKMGDGVNTVSALPFLIEDAPFKPAGKSYLTFSSPNSFTLAVRDATKHWDGTLEYFASDKTWTVWEGTTTLSSVDNDGEYVLYLRGSGNTKIGYYDTDLDDYVPWVINGTDVRCDGNIETLLDYRTVETGEHPVMAEECFGGLFLGCTSLTQAPALPATTLATYCYSTMFYGCTSLTQAPALPATTLAEGCYSAMFWNCTGLTQAPALPATTLAAYCYDFMFFGCTSLTQAPALPATKLAAYCYESMFWNCSSLTQVPALPATTLADSCYNSMFWNCSSLAKVPTLPATTLTNACYKGMFAGCTGLKLSSIQTGEYTQEYRIPITGTGTTAADALTDMFFSTGGTFTGTPEINTTYYLSTDNMIIRNNDIATLREYVGSIAAPASHASDTSIHVTAEEKTAWDAKATTTYVDQKISEIPTPDVSGQIGTHNSDSSAHSDIRESITTHTGNTSIHVTAEEKTSWNAKADAPFKPTGKSYLTFSSPNSFTLAVGDATKHWDGTLEYFAADKTWTTWDGTTTLSSVDNDGEYVLYLRGTGNTVITGGSFDHKWVLTGSDIACIGNIENLLDYATVETGQHPRMGESCYYSMFNGCTSLTQAPALPATTLADSCYNSMFNGCTSLTQAPALPATTLERNCYLYMFRGCTGITQAPALPATRLAAGCYAEMFNGCTGITQAPALPATRLERTCYTGMFYGCTSLTQAPALPATRLDEACYEEMFNGCTSLKLSSTKTGEYTQEYRISTTGTGTTASSALTNMFAGTGGTFTGTPSINTTYYLSSDNMVVRETEIATLNGYVGSMIDGVTPFKPAGKSYLTFSSPNSFTLAVGDAKEHWDGTLEYFASNKTWTTWDGTTTLSAVDNDGEYVLYLRGIGNTKFGYFDEADTYDYVPWTINGTDVRCDGNIETLLDYATVEGGQHPMMAKECFAGLFMGCTSLTQAPALPATTLATYCYNSMFYGCTSLIQAPALPATTLAISCYNSMFRGCTSLTQAPALPATTLAISCYGYMFYDCTSLTQAPALPATTLAGGCYQHMFYGCTNITQAPALPATTLADGCYIGMFYGCTGLKLSSAQTGEYTVAYRIPTAGTGTTATDALTDMFTDTGGTFTGTPAINTTYYLSSDNMVVRETEIATLNGYVGSMIDAAIDNAIGGGY